MIYLFILIAGLLAYVFANPSVGSASTWILTILFVMGIAFVASLFAEVTVAEDISEELRD